MPKPRNIEITMARIGKQDGIDVYAPMDADAARALGGRAYFLAKIPTTGRSLPQNSLWAVWYNEIGKLMGMDAREVKKECKLNYGVPILCAESEKFRRMWLAKFENDSYEKRLFMMEYLPVTSLFSRHGGIAYTESLQRNYAEQGINLIVR